MTKFETRLQAAANDMVDEIAGLNKATQMLNKKLADVADLRSHQEEDEMDVKLTEAAYLLDQATRLVITTLNSLDV